MEGRVREVKHQGQVLATSSIARVLAGAIAASDARAMTRSMANTNPKRCPIDHTEQDAEVVTRTGHRIRRKRSNDKPAQVALE